MGRYRTVVADPPWDVGRGPEWASNGKSRPLTYPTMTVDEIAALPVREWADKRAHLYIWTINAYIEETYEIARLWGFKPSTLLTWCKPPNGIGLGGTYSLTTEHVLFARRGRLARAVRQHPRAVAPNPLEVRNMAERTTDPPIGGALYRHPRLRGRWRLETAGPKWIRLRSLEVVNLGGAWSSVRVAREDWPGEWTRA